MHKSINSKSNFLLEYRDLKNDIINHLKSINFLKEEEIINTKLNSINIEEILSKNKINILLKNNLSEEEFNIDILSNIILKDILPDLNNFLDLIYSKIEDKNISEFLDISDKYIYKFLIKIINDLDINAVLDSVNILEIIENIKLIDLFENSKSINKIISTFIKKIINEKFFIDFINSLIEIVFDTIYKNNTPISELINPDLQVKLYFFLENNLLLLLNSLKTWVKKNKTTINQIIEDTIEEYFEEQEFFGQLKLMIKDFLGIKISETFNLVEKIINQFENYFSNSASSDFIESIIRFLDEKTLKDILDILNIDKDKSISITNNFIFSIINDLPDNSLEFLLKINILEIMKFINGNNININKTIIKLVKNYIKGSINNSINNNKKVKISSFFTRKKFNSAKSYLPFLLMFGQSKIKEYLNKFIVEIGFKSKIISSIDNLSIDRKLNSNYKVDIYNLILEKFKTDKDYFLENIDKYIEKEDILLFYKRNINNTDEKKKTFFSSIKKAFTKKNNIKNLQSLYIDEDLIKKLNEKFLLNSNLDLKTRKLYSIVTLHLYNDDNDVHNIIENYLRNKKIDNTKEVSNFLFNNIKLLLLDIFENFIISYINNKKLSDLIETKEIIDSINQNIDVYDFKSNIENIKNEVLNSNFDIEKYINKDLKIIDIYDFKNQFNIENINLNTYIDKLIKYIISESIINTELSSEKEINSLFNGELMNFIKNNINKMTKIFIFDSTINKLKKEQNNITNILIKNYQEYIKDNPLYEIGNSILNFEKDIKEIVDILINKKLSIFFESKEREIENIINSYIELLSYKKLGDIGISGETFNIDNLMLILNNTYDNLNLNELITNIINSIDSKNLSVDKTINIFGFNNINEFVLNLKKIFIENLDKIIPVLEENNIKNILKDSFLKLINDNLSNYKLKDIFDDNFIVNTIYKLDKIINEIYLDKELINKNNQYSDILSKKLNEINIYDLFFKDDEKFNFFIEKNKFT